MNDTIKVGDRVRLAGSDTSGLYTVLALDRDRAWVRADAGGHYNFCALELIRIEPEKVTLMPKYAVGESVRTAGNKTETVIKGIFITYETTNLGTWDESELEPVPAPCPECKGSGKASE